MNQAETFEWLRNRVQELGKQLAECRGKPHSSISSEASHATQIESLTGRVGEIEQENTRLREFYRSSVLDETNSTHPRVIADRYCCCCGQVVKESL